MKPPTLHNKISNILGNHRLQTASATVAIFAIIGLSASAQGQVIVSDNFNLGGKQQSIQGLTLEGANLPGTAWSVSSSTSSGDFYAWTDTTAFATNPTPDVSGSLWIWNFNQNGYLGGDATVSIASANGYVKPTQLAITADFLFQSTFNSGSSFLLGFYSSPADPNNGTTNPLTGFTGLSLDPNAGTLTLVENGVLGTSDSLLNPVNQSAFGTLSYDVNTTTGGISDVMYADGSYSFSSTAFTDAATQNAGLGIDGHASANGYADNFSVSGVVPEPSTWALMGAGLLGLFLIRRRRTASGGAI